MSMTLEQPRVHFHPLSFLAEADETVVGRADIDSYCILSADGAALLRELQAGRTPHDAGEWYRATYGERVDIDDFVATLRDLEFVREDDGPEAAPEPVRWQRLGRALFSPIAWLCYAALAAGAVAVCVADHALLPRRENVFFSNYLVIVELTVFVGQLVLSTVHEVFHVLAGRRLGLRSSVRLSRRLYFLVFETVLDGLVVVPRRRRYLPILAGLLADVLAVSALTVAAYVLHGLVGRICLALAFTTLPRMAWQFYFYLRTDIYYLLTTVLGCTNLDVTARTLLRNKANALLRRPHRLIDESQWHPHDRQVARWYAPLLVIGYSASVAMLLLVVLPLGWRFVDRATQRVFFGGARSSGQLWDSAFLLTLTVVQLALAAALGLRELRGRRRTVT